MRALLNATFVSALISSSVFAGGQGWSHNFEEARKQNEELREQYRPAGYPTILLVDDQGRPYAKTGYESGGPEASTRLCF